MSRLAYWCLCVFTFAVPWENAIVLPGAGAISSAVGIVALGAGLLSVAYRQKMRLLSGVHVWMIAFVLMAGLSAVWSVDSNLTLARVTTYVQLLVMVWLIWEIARTKESQYGLMSAYVWGAYVTIIAIVWTYATQGGAGQSYVVPRFDPNELGLTIALGIPMAWRLSLLETSKTAAWIRRLYAPLGLLAILLTGSRGAFVAAVVALTFVPLSVFRLSTRQKFGLVLTAAVAVAMLFNVPDSAWQRVSSIGMEVSSGTMANRRNIWQAGFELFSQHPIRGLGAGAFSTAVEPLLGEPKLAHNTFLSILVEQGVIGFCLFLTPVLLMLMRLRRLGKLEALQWLILLASWTAGVSTLSWEYRKPTWLLFGLLAARLACHVEAQESTSTRRVLADAFRHSTG